MKRTRALASAVGLAVLVGFGGCATPRVTLKHPKTGQVVSCGGGTTGSLAGGMIGHEMQKKSDAECVRRYETQGFKRQ